MPTRTRTKLLDLVAYQNQIRFHSASWKERYVVAAAGDERVAISDALPIHSGSRRNTETV